MLFPKYKIEISPRSLTGGSLTEPEARIIAEKSCIKGGEALSAGSYNKTTKTWWFDANLNAAREGCNPACVVNEESKTAEINWRCTGLVPPDQQKPLASGECGAANCHGLDIECGQSAQMCTEMYQLGDRCRQYAKCGVVNGKCQQIENQEFNICKACALKCDQDFPDNPEKAFMCESRCGE